MNIPRTQAQCKSIKHALQAQMHVGVRQAVTKKTGKDGKWDALQSPCQSDVQPQLIVAGKHVGIRRPDFHISFFFQRNQKYCFCMKYQDLVIDD